MAATFNERYLEYRTSTVPCHQVHPNDYTSFYKTRLILLNLLPLMYLFELHDILFAIKSLKSPTIQFNITNYINFNPANARSGTSNKLISTHHLNNLSRHSYCHRHPSLWNAMPVIDLNMYFSQLKSKLKSVFGMIF